MVATQRPQKEPSGLYHSFLFLKKYVFFFKSSMWYEKGMLLLHTSLNTGLPPALNWGLKFITLKWISQNWHMGVFSTLFWTPFYFHFWFRFTVTVIWKLTLVLQLYVIFINMFCSGDPYRSEVCKLRFFSHFSLAQCKILCNVCDRTICVSVFLN